MVVLTGATVRVDGIVVDGSAKVFSGLTVCNNNIVPAAVATAVDVDELNIQDGRDNLREKKHLQEEGARKSTTDGDRRDTSRIGWIKVNACAGETLNREWCTWSSEVGIDASRANGENSWDWGNLRRLEL